jgi:hypothetical protein
LLSGHLLRLHECLLLLLLLLLLSVYIVAQVFKNIVEQLQSAVKLNFDPAFSGYRDAISDLSAKQLL